MRLTLKASILPSLTEVQWAGAVFWLSFTIWFVLETVEFYWGDDDDEAD